MSSARTTKQTHMYRQKWGRYLGQLCKQWKGEAGTGNMSSLWQWCTLHLILLGWLNQQGWDGEDKQHAWNMGYIYTTRNRVEMCGLDSTSLG